MKINKTYLYLVFCLLTITISKTTFAQFNRVMNNDSLFFNTDRWQISSNNSINDVDSNTVIISFSNNATQSDIALFLQNNYMQIVDSLYHYKLCRFNNTLDTNLINGFSNNLDICLSSNLISATYLNTFGEMHSNPDDPYFVNRSANSQYDNTTSITPHILFQSGNGNEAWTKTKGDSSIIVAVIDAEPDWSHEDLGEINKRDNIWRNTNENTWLNDFIPNDDRNINALDLDGDGLKENYKGYDFYYNDNDTRPGRNFGRIDSCFTANNHGTNVMGIIGAISNNGLGVAGIAGGDFSNTVNKRGVQIMPLNVFSQTCDVVANEPVPKLWPLMKAIDYAAKKNANIITMSLGMGNNKIVPLSFVLDKARNTYGALIFCSSGNDILGQLNYPSFDENVASVGGLLIKSGAFQNGFTVGNFSNGKKLSFVMIAENVITTDNNGNNKYTTTFGHTSASAPIVASMAALVNSYFPCFTNDDIYEILKQGALNYNEYLGDSISYPFENNTNSNEWGYGFPSFQKISPILESMELETQIPIQNSKYILTANTSISSDKIARYDIIIKSGATLTITNTANVVLAKNTKIEVEPGGKLVIDGGKLYNRCGWNGIVVQGIDGQAQNNSTFGKVTVQNGGTIENAWTAIKSINGGIVYLNNANLTNNYQSVYFQKHNSGNSNLQLSSVQNSTFKIDNEFLPLKYNNAENTKASFLIRVENIKNLSIINNSFENTYETIDFDVTKAIVGLNAQNINIRANYFYGFKEAINLFAINGLRSYAIISGNNENDPNEFVNNKTAIMLNNVQNVLIKYNQIELPTNTNVSNPVGIYMIASSGRVFNNTITNNETSPGNGYGIVSRFARRDLSTNIYQNIFTNLKYGTQVEGRNSLTQVYCNDYSTMAEAAWSISPNFNTINAFPDQGEYIKSDLEDGMRRAGNLFNDETENNLTQHIRSNLEFKYAHATEPSQAEPDFYSSEVALFPFIENNSSSCPELNENSCELINCPNPDLLVKLGLTENRDSIRFYQEMILNNLILSDNYDSIKILLDEWKSNNEYYIESLIEASIAYSKFNNTNGFINMYNRLTQRDIDYIDFHSMLKDKLLNNQDLKDLTSTDSATLYAIANRYNDVSEVVKQYLNEYTNEDFEFVPEQWSEGDYIAKSVNGTDSVNSKENFILNEDFIVYPNPANNYLDLLFENLNHSTNYKVLIKNALGSIVEEFTIDGNKSSLSINISEYLSGIYYIVLTNENSSIIINHKKCIVLK